MATEMDNVNKDEGKEDDELVDEVFPEIEASDSEKQRGESLGSE